MRAVEGAEDFKKSIVSNNIEAIKKIGINLQPFWSFELWLESYCPHQIVCTLAGSPNKLVEGGTPLLLASEAER